MKTERHIDVLNVLTLTACMTVAILYFFYMLLCLIGLDARAMAVFALIVMAVVLLPVIFRKPLADKFGKRYRLLQRIFTAVLYLYLASLVIFWCYIGFASAHTVDSYAKTAESGDSGENTVVMVFGCHTYGYTPGPSLKLRLDETVRLLEIYPNALCLVSGGQGSNETVTEAESMRAYLVASGISESRILCEDKSHSTSENIRFSKALLKEKNLYPVFGTVSATPTRIIGISTDFHLPRIEALAKRYGLTLEVCSAPSQSFAMYYVSMIREYLSYIKMALFDELVIDVGK